MDHVYAWYLPYFERLPNHLCWQIACRLTTTPLNRDRKILKTIQHLGDAIKIEPSICALHRVGPTTGVGPKHCDA